MGHPTSIAFLSSAGRVVALVAPVALVSAVAAVSLAAAVGCTAFTTDESGAAGDASTAADGGAGDATSSDAALSEVGAFTNAFCAGYVNDPRVLYCNDLESPGEATTPFGFDRIESLPTTTTVALVTDAERTKVLSEIANAPNGGSHGVLAVQPLGLSTGGPLNVQIDVDIKIVSDDAMYATLAALHVAGTACEASFGLGAFGTDRLGGTRVPDVPLQPYVKNVWKHLTISLQKTSASSTGYREVTTYGGVTLVDREAHASNGADPSGCNNNDLTLGVTDTMEDPASIHVLFDNVLVRKLE